MQTQRSKFTHSDDIDMLKWAVNNRWIDKESPFGLATWRRFIKHHNTHHTEQSLLGRFRRHTVPNIHMYAGALKNSDVARAYNIFRNRLDVHCADYLRKLIGRAEKNSTEEQDEAQSAARKKKNVEHEREEEDEEPVAVNVTANIEDEEEEEVEIEVSRSQNEIQEQENRPIIETLSDMNTTVPIAQEEDNLDIEEPSSFSSHAPNEFWNNDMLPYIESASRKMYKKIYEVTNDPWKETDIKPADEADIQKLFQKIFSPTLEPLRKIVILPLKQPREVLRKRYKGYRHLEKLVSSSENSTHSKNAAIHFFMYFEYQLAQQLIVKNETRYEELIAELIEVAGTICSF